MISRRARHGSHRRPVEAPKHDGLYSPFVNTSFEAIRFYTLLAFLFICVMGGGASRVDVLSLLYLRPAAIICLLVLVATPGRWDFRRYRMLFLMFGLLAATMLVQLIPLPPSFGLSLPGRARFAEAAAAANIALPWWPISLRPDLTLNSLLALLPPLVALVGLAAIREDQRRALLPILIGILCVDAFWSILQFAGGGDSPAYLYAVTSPDAPVGVFSNRNHHAVLLALGFPMLAVWLRMPVRSREHNRTRLWMAGALGLFLIPGILVTGSRAGVGVGAAGIVAAFFLGPRLRIDLRGRWRRPAQALALLLPLAFVAVTVFANRAISLERFIGAGNIGSEHRAAAVPTLLTMTREFAPQGTGFGTFDAAYRVFEPDFLLGPTYLNHAHNDLIELALTGGVPAMLVLALFLGWWLKRTVQAFFRAQPELLRTHFARLGAVMILFLLGASLVDYPLRTPLMSIVFTIACGWLASNLASRERGGQAEETGADTPPEESAKRPNWIGRLAVCLVLGAGLGWVTMGVTAANTLGRARPSLVTPWWPFDANMKVAAATLSLRDRDSRPTFTVAVRLSEAALRREPLNVAAVRTLGIVAAVRGDEARAARLMRFSETLSRRDLATQLWLIENSVQQNDIPGTLRHYDRALRTSGGAGDILFPILVSASANRDVMLPVARLVATRPIWWRDFARRLVTESRSPLAIATILGALRLNPEDTPERDLLVAAFNRLTESRNFAHALHLYQRAAGPSVSRELVRNGGFQIESRLPPFDWAFTDQLDLAGRIETAGSSPEDQALFVTSGNGVNGEVARQLLVLRPGRYRLTLRAGGVVSPVELERPQVTLLCAGGPVTIFRHRLPDSPDSGGLIARDFAIPPSGCPAQWLSIRAIGPLNGSAPRFWIDDVAVRPRG